jgi:hypothetical protein
MTSHRSSYALEGKWQQDCQGLVGRGELRHGYRIEEDAQNVGVFPAVFKNRGFTTTMPLVKRIFVGGLSSSVLKCAERIKCVGMLRRPGG